MYKGQLSYSVAFNVIMTDELYLLAPADRLMTKRDMYLATLHLSADGRQNKCFSINRAAIADLSMCKLS